MQPQSTKTRTHRCYLFQLQRRPHRAKPGRHMRADRATLKTDDVQRSPLLALSNRDVREVLRTADCLPRLGENVGRDSASPRGKKMYAYGGTPDDPWHTLLIRVEGCPTPTAAFLHYMPCWETPLSGVHSCHEQTDTQRHTTAQYVTSAPKHLLTNAGRCPGRVGSGPLLSESMIPLPSHRSNKAATHPNCRGDTAKRSIKLLSKIPLCLALTATPFRPPPHVFIIG